MKGDCCEAISWSNNDCYPHDHFHENTAGSSDTLSGNKFCHGYTYPSTSYDLTASSSESLPASAAASHDDADHYTLEAYSRLLSPLMYNAQIIMKRIGHFHDVPFVNPALTFGTPPHEFEIPPPKHYTKRTSISEVNNNVIRLPSLCNDTSSTFSPIRSRNNSDNFSHLCNRIMPGFDGSGGRFGQGSRFGDGSQSRENNRGAENGFGFNKSESDRPANRFDRGGSTNTGFNDADTYKNDRSRNDIGFNNQRQREFEGPKNDRYPRDDDFNSRRDNRFDGNRHDDRRDHGREFTQRDNDGGRGFDNKKEFGRNEQGFSGKDHDSSSNRNGGSRFNERDSYGDQSFGKGNDGQFNRGTTGQDNSFGKDRSHASGGYKSSDNVGFNQTTQGFGGGRDDSFRRKKPEDEFRPNRQTDNFGGSRDNSGFGGNRDRFRGNRDQDAFGGAQRGSGCFNCGENGHRSNECSQPKKGGRSDNGGFGFKGGRDNDNAGFGGSGWGNKGGRDDDNGGSGWGNKGGRNDDNAGSGWGNKGGRDNDTSGFGGSGFGNKDASFGSARPGGCFNCGQHGHRANECSEPRKDNRGGDGGARPGGCFNCGQHGHRANECSEPRKDNRGGDGGARPGGCFNCGQQGHRANECNEPRKDNRGGGFDDRKKDFEDSGPRAPRDWAPDEENIDDLYAVDRKTIDDFDPSADSDVIISGPRKKPAITSWENSPLDHQLTAILVNKMHFARPRKIQGAVIPQVLNGDDVLAQADTGSGKTLAFVLPILHMAMQNPNRNNRCKPFALVVTPTRELAQQIHENFQKMGDPIGLRSVLIIGQMSAFVINSKIREGCDVIVGTPGKMMEFICRKGEISLCNLKIFVLDEADKMLDSNDNHHLQEIMDNRSFKERRRDNEIQTLLFSATVSDDFQRQCNKFLREGSAIVASNTKGGRSANPRVKQTYVETEDKAAKNDKLCELFDAKNPESKRLKTLIFVKRKDDCNFVAADLADSCNIPVASLSGNLPQNERSKHIKEFKNNKLTVLVATDVCARGIDIPELDRVIVFDMPDWSHKNKEEAIDVFIHRIGRTGRIKKGEAIVFIQPSTDSDFAPHLVKLCETAGQQPPEFLKNLGAGGGAFGGGGFGGSEGGFGGSGFGGGGFGADAAGSFGQNGGGFGGDAAGGFGQNGGGFGGDAAGGFGQNGDGFASEAANFSSGFGSTQNASESNGFGGTPNDENDFGKNNSMGNAGFTEKKNVIEESVGQSGFGSDDEEDNNTVRDTNVGDW